MLHVEPPYSMNVATPCTDPPDAFAAANSAETARLPWMERWDEAPACRPSCPRKAADACAALPWAVPSWITASPAGLAAVTALLEFCVAQPFGNPIWNAAAGCTTVSYTHLRAHE